jgi:hypothetical protein
MEINLTKKKTLNLTDINSNSYYLYEYIGISIGDPISSLFMNDKYAIIGTMMGRIVLLSLTSDDKKRRIIINNASQENITGISLSDDNSCIFASIGDEQILKQEIEEPLSNNLPASSSIKLYESEKQHNLCCDNSYIMMATYNLIKLNIFQPDLEDKIKDVFVDYEIVYFNEKEFAVNNRKGKISTTNFYVPMDFDGYLFCWIEYLNDKEDRNICIQDVLKDNVINDADTHKFIIDKNYGHVGHIKLLTKNRILIVHNLNNCEIRNISDNFEILEKFTHIGDEVYSVHVYYNDTNTFCGENKTFDIKTNIKKNEYTKYTMKIDNIDFSPKMNSNDNKLNESQKLSGKKLLPKIENSRIKKVSVANSIELKTDSLNLLKNKPKKRFTENVSLSIITLDIDGNVNKYENESEEKLFNLYDIKGIEQDHKDKQFFNMGYAYYIKTDLNFFCISTDHGCYIIKKIENE